MLDIPPAPEKIPIGNCQIKQSEPGKFSICLHEECVYVLANAIYYFPMKAPLKWAQINPVPFGPRQGQSMTSTPHGLAFFGGKEGSSCFHNDLWLYNKGEWSYVTCSVPARSHHAAVWDPRGYLLICGGQKRDAYLNDIYLVDLGKQETTPIQIDNMPAISTHTITYTTDGNFILFGGTTNTNRAVPWNSSIFKVNIEKREISKITTDFENTGFYSHFAAYLYGRLFVFGGGNASDGIAWMFDFNHNVWIPINFDVKICPVFIFCSAELSANKALHVLNDSFNELLTYYIFSENPPENVDNHPQFLHFLQKNIENGIRFFDHYENPHHATLKNRISEVHDAQMKLSHLTTSANFVKVDDANETIGLLRDYEVVRNVLLHAERVKRIMDATPPRESATRYYSDDKESDSNSDNQSVHQIVIELRNIRKQMKQEMAPLDNEANKLCLQIECATFDALNAAFAATQNDKVQSIADFERMQENSKQLAQEIKFERERVKEGLERLSSVDKHKEIILNIRDQLWGVSKREVEISKELQKTKSALFKSLAELIKLRNDELMHTSSEARSAAMNLVGLPYAHERLTDTLKKLDKLKAGLVSAVEDLDFSRSVQREGSISNKLKNVTEALRELSEWADAAKIAGLSDSSLDENERQCPLFTSFEESVGNRHVLMKDVDQLLSEIERKLKEI